MGWGQREGGGGNLNSGTSRPDGETKVDQGVAKQVERGRSASH